MDIKLIKPGDLLWGQMLARVPHDIYHLEAYVSAVGDHERGTPLAIYVEEGQQRLFVPVIRRPVPLTGDAQLDSHFDLSSPYGYPGPLVECASKASTNGFVETAMKGALSFLREQHVVSIFLRLHPLLEMSEEGLSRTGVSVEHGQTVVIDLKNSEAAIWSQIRHGHRYEINRAQKQGLTAFIDEDWANLDAFIELYNNTMKRVEASSQYFFSKEYFIRLRETLPGRIHLCVVKAEDQVAAAGLFTETGGIVQYHLSSSRFELAKLHPTKLMIDFAWRWAKARGNRALHLGGGKGGLRDSLFQFKAGFSKHFVPYRTWSTIVNPTVYEALVSKLKPYTAGASANYFPAYRYRADVQNANKSSA